MRLQVISLSDGAVSPIPAKTLLCLGNFDGVHLGHRALIGQAKELRDEWFSDAALCVFCFSAPSGDYLSSAPLPHLSSLRQKLALFEECGAEYAIIADFPEIRNLSPVDFVLDVLNGSCNAVGAVCGFNYRFGCGGKGDAKLLGELLPTAVCAEVREDGDTVSSTRIRRLIATGELEAANRLLGRPYSITSEIVHGKALGQKLGFPTINQGFPPSMLIPPYGVYVTECCVDGVSYRGVSNVGIRPTVDSAASVNCETHLLGCSEDLYGKEATVSFLRFLRPEERFDTVEALKAQVEKDIAAAESAVI